MVLVLAAAPSGRIVYTRQRGWPAGAWGLVAGYVEEGETAEQAAARELLEETGLSAGRVEVIGTMSWRDQLLICCAAAIEDVTPVAASDVEEVCLAVPSLDRTPADWPARTLVEQFIERRAAESPQGRAGRAAVTGHALAAAIVVTDAAGQVLLVRHGYGRRNWEIPGGGSEPGESARDTALREAREELGVEVRIGDLVGVYWEPAWRGGLGMHHFVFRAELLGELPAHSPDTNEITEWGWFTVDQPPRPISDFTLRRIRDAMERRPAELAVIEPRRWLE